MSRKDFVLIANVLRVHKNRYRAATPQDAIISRVLAEVTSSFASELSRTNPRFNIAMFLRAASRE